MRCGRPSQESRCADRGCIANLRLRAAAGCCGLLRAAAGCCGLQAEGVLWLAHGFGTLDLVRADKEDLSIGRSSGWRRTRTHVARRAGVEVPPFAWAALERVRRRPSALSGFGCYW